MKKLIFLIVFLITNLAFGQANFNKYIGKSKLDIVSFMEINPNYYCDVDTTTEISGELLRYGLIDNSDESIKKRIILSIGFYFRKDICDGVRFIIFGSDALGLFIVEVDKNNLKVSPNVWINRTYSTAIRITRIPPHNGIELDIYQIDIGIVDLSKN